MPSSSSYTLLPASSLKPMALALSEALNKIPFENNAENNLQENLATQRRDLQSGQCTPAAYCQSDALAQAMREIENRNHYFLLGLMHIWYKQAHAFSSFQKFLLTASSLVLIAAAVLSREGFVLLLDGKPKLEATGAAIADYCTTGLSNRVVDICSTLEDGMTAVFNMNTASRDLPSYIGEVNDTLNGPIPKTGVQSIASWFIPTGWIDFFTCTFQNNNTEMVGHAYFGTAEAAIAKASNGFPIALMDIPLNPNPILNAIELSALVQMFLAGFCIKIQEGGYSTFTTIANQDYGHFDGYERGATAFEGHGYAFAGTYGGITGVALLTTIFLLAKKACEKWDAALVAREEFKAVNSAAALFHKLHQATEKDAMNGRLYSKITV